MTRGATRNRGEKGRIVHTRSQLREPQRTQGSKVKGSAEAQSQVEVAVRKSQFASRSSQYAVAVRKSPVMQVDAVASQTLTLRGNECLDFVEVQKGLYTKVCHCFPSDSEHVRDNLLYFPTISCVNQTHPYWRATAMWSATNQDLRSHRRVDF